MKVILAACVTVFLSTPQAGAADALARLSPRALEIGKMKSGEREALDGRCRQKSNWQSVDCVARRELESANMAELRTSDTENLGRLRQLCAEGDQDTCLRIACPSDGAMMFGTIDGAKACSRYRRLPITAEWAQVSDIRNEREHQAGYICLRPLKLLDPYSEPIEVLPDTIVSAKIGKDGKPGRFEAEAIHDKDFPTREAAADAGCRVARHRYADLLKAGGMTPLD